MNQGQQREDCDHRGRHVEDRLTVQGGPLF
jgi:hypothetical protein